MIWLPPHMALCYCYHSASFCISRPFFIHYRLLYYFQVGLECKLCIMSSLTDSQGDILWRTHHNLQDGMSGWYTIMDLDNQKNRTRKLWVCCKGLIWNSGIEGRTKQKELKYTRSLGLESLFPLCHFFLSCACCISISTSFSFPKGSIHQNLPHAFVSGIKNKIHFLKITLEGFPGPRRGHSQL